MRKKNGFTLVELLTVIVILGIVLTIAVIGFSSIRKRILQRQYENLVTEIKASADLYFKNVEVSEVYVQTLIDDGLFKADDVKGNVYNPINKNIMNCDLIQFNDGGTLTYQENPNGECRDLGNQYKTIKLVILENGEHKTIKDTWYNDAKVLTYEVSNNIVINSPNHIWTTSKNPSMSNETGSQLDLKKYIENGIFNQSVKLTIKDGENGKIYTSGDIRVKIDAVKPIVNGDANITTQTGKLIIKVNATDEGSGIDSYILTTENTCDNLNWDTAEKLSGKKSEDITITLNEKEQDIYNLCVKDIADNTSDPKQIDLTDIVIPTPDLSCRYVGGKTNWSKDSVKIEYECKSNSNKKTQLIKINCDNSYSINNSSSYIFNINKYDGKALERINPKDYNLCFTCKDENNKTVTCPIGDEKLNIYLDYAKPTIELIEIKSTSDTYNSNNVIIRFKTDDVGSGIGKIVLNINNKDITLFDYSNDGNFDGFFRKNNGVYELNINNLDYKMYKFKIKAYDRVDNSSDSKQLSYEVYKPCTKINENVKIGTYEHSEYCSEDCYGECGQCYKLIYGYYYDYYYNDIICSKYEEKIASRNAGRCRECPVEEPDNPVVDCDSNPNQDGCSCKRSGMRCNWYTGQLIDIGCCEEGATVCGGVDTYYLAPAENPACQGNSGSNENPNPGGQNPNPGQDPNPGQETKPACSSAGIAGQTEWSCVNINGTRQCCKTRYKGQDGNWHSAKDDGTFGVCDDNYYCSPGTGNGGGINLDIPL